MRSPQRTFIRDCIAALVILFLGLGIGTRAIADAQHVRAGDTDFAYIEAGQGEAVVFVHGGLQDYRLWQSHLAAFSGQYRAIAYSRRNHYPNAVSLESAPDGAADLHGEDLAGIVKALGLRRVHVAAHSSGAHAALFFAANHPDMVITLTVNEPPASGLLMETAEQRDIAAKFNAQLEPAREAFRKGDMQNAVRLFVDAVSGPGTYERRPEDAKQMMLENAVSHAADAITKRPRAVFTCAMAKRITAPTLITQGSRSPAFFGAVVDELAACLPNRERVSIVASHTVPMENPREFDAAVLSFISRHRPGAASRSAR